jgi:hypothetical protein
MAWYLIKHREDFTFTISVSNIPNNLPLFLVRGKFNAYDSVGTIYVKKKKAASALGVALKKVSCIYG